MVHRYVTAVVLQSMLIESATSPCKRHSATTNANDARRTERLPGHQCLDYLVKRPLIKNRGLFQKTEYILI